MNHLNLLFFLAIIPKSRPRRSATATCLFKPFPGVMSCLLLICSMISFSEKPSSDCPVLSRSYTRIDFRTISIEDTERNFVNESIGEFFVTEHNGAHVKPRRAFIVHQKLLSYRKIIRNDSHRSSNTGFYIQVNGSINFS